MHRSGAVWIRRTIASAIGVLLAAGPFPAPAQQPPGDAQLRQELDAVKEQLRRVEQQMRQQEELIRRLIGERPAAPAAPPGTAPAPPGAPPGPAVTAPARPIAPGQPGSAPAYTPDIEELKRMVLQEIQPQLAAANKTFPSQFNPAIGFVVDTVFSHSRQKKSNFEFRSAEIGISGNIDPFARAYGIINGTPDGVDVEEAAIVTTSLPWGLTVKGGRFFAEFGRLSTWHDHDLPFVNRPMVLDQYVGGESQADGVEVNWLAPIPHYLSFTLGAYNKIGADNDRVDNTVPRDLSEFTVLGRVNTFFNLTDSIGLDVGASNAYTPEVRSEALRERNLFGVDVTLRYTPLSQAAYRGFIWGTEVLVNHESRPGITPTEDSPNQIFRVRDSFGLYSYLEARLTRRYYPGLLYEYLQDIDRPSLSTWALSPYFTIWLSEFQRLRLQYTHLQSNRPGTRPTDDQFFLQWTAIIGSHVHSFRDR
jgi:hypothetical protein